MADSILLLSWTVPPETTGSAVIVGNLAKQFSRSQMIVAGERPRNKPAIVWKDEWPEISYVSKAWPQTRRGARWWRKLQIPVLVLRCLRLAWKQQCTRIVVVFPCEEYLLVGYMVAKITGAALFPYFHNTYVEQCEPHTLHARIARWFQSRVFREAGHVFVMSDGMVELYGKRYPHVKCSALLHSFNEDIPDYNAPPPVAEPSHFMLSGNINESCTDAATRLAAAVSLVNGRLTILSGTPKAHLQKLGMMRDGVRHETVSRDLLVGRLAEADVVLLAHGFTGGLSDEEYRTIFPTKTIEYLICGRPILAHAPADCYLTRFLCEHGCALVVDRPDHDDLVTAIHRLCADAALRASLVRNALRVARRFQASIVAASLRSVLYRI
jgi:glycosyltransferase involved in cell wall biosynthesis